MLINIFLLSILEFRQINVLPFKNNSCYRGQGLKEAKISKSSGSSRRLSINRMGWISLIDKRKKKQEKQNKTKQKQ